MRYVESATATTVSYATHCRPPYHTSAMSLSVDCTGPPLLQRLCAGGFHAGKLSDL